MKHSNRRSVESIPFSFNENENYVSKNRYQKDKGCCFLNSGGNGKKGGPGLGKVFTYLARKALVHAGHCTRSIRHACCGFSRRARKVALRTVAAHIPGIASPTYFLRSSTCPEDWGRVYILDIAAYACGVKSVPACILNQNSFFGITVRLPVRRIPLCADH